MSEEKFKKQWENYSKSDKLSWIIYSILICTFLLGFLYITFGSIMEDMLRLTYKNIEVLTIWNIVALISMGFGFIFLSTNFIEVINKIFYPETEDEKLISKLLKEFNKKYPSKIARLRKEELKKELELSKIKLKLEKIQNE